MARPSTPLCLVILMAILLPLLGGADEAGLLGSLYVTTAPAGAAVYVNGELRGVSPCGIGDVGVGSVDVRAERQGFASASTSVKVEGGQIARVDLTLSPIPNVGSLAVLVEPQGAQIEVDRVPAGRTPKVILNVVAGTHRVSVSRSGFLPRQWTVTLAPGEDGVLSGRLQPTAGAQAPAPAAGDLADTGALEPDKIPPTADLPEDGALEPVRKLIADRRYDDALARLDTISAAAAPELGRRIGRERMVVRRIREVVAAGYGRLREVEGQEYVLLLRGGIRYPCSLVQVTGEEVKVRIGEREQTIPLRQISAEQIVRLASHAMDPARAANRTRFALLYAAEGDYEPAYEELRAAAQEGYDVASDKSFVDAERLWAAAVAKEERLRVLARSGAAPAALMSLRAIRRVPLLVDTFHGRELPKELAEAAGASGLDVGEQAGAFRPEDAEQRAVLLVCDPGPGGRTPPYDRQEIQNIINFVQAGGGLVYVGAVRPMPQSQPGPPSPEPADPFAALLRWTGILVQPGGLSVSKEAQASFPRQYVPAYPAMAHPVVNGVRRVVFAAPVAPLLTDRTAVVLLRAPPQLLAEGSGERAPALMAASTLGKGRVLVLSAMPLTRQSPWDGSVLNVNDAPRALRNGLIWVSEPVREAKP